MWQEDWQENLDKYRQEIDKIDYEFLELLTKRMECSEKIGDIKSQHDLPVYVPERERRIIATRQQWGKKYGLASKFVRVLFKIIMWQSKELQGKLIEKDKVYAG